MLHRIVVAVSIVFGLVGCGGGSGDAPAAGTPSTNTNSPWGNSSLASRQAHYKNYNAVMLHRVHPRAPNEVPNHWPMGSFLDVFEQQGKLKARFLYLSLPSQDRNEQFFDIIGDEHVYVDSRYPRTILNPIGPFLASPQVNRGDYQNEAFLTGQGEPRVMWSFINDSQVNQSGYTFPSSLGNGGGELKVGFVNGGATRLEHVADTFYGFGCSEYNKRVEDAWMFKPDFQILQMAPVFLYDTLAPVIEANLLNGRFAPASCASTSNTEHGVLLSYAYSLDPANDAPQKRGRIALVRYDGNQFQLLGKTAIQSDFIAVDQIPALRILQDSLTPQQPYVISMQGRQLTVYQLNGNTLERRFGTTVNSGNTQDQAKIWLRQQLMVMHGGKLIIHPPTSSTNDWYYANQDGALQPYKRGLLTENFDSLTMMKSVGGKLYVGVRHVEEKPYRHDIGELIRIDE